MSTWQALWAATAGRLHQSSLAGCFERKAGEGVTHPPPSKRGDKKGKETKEKGKS